MYVIHFDSGRTESCTTLAGVLAFFNCNDDLRRRTSVDAVSVRHIARGDIPLVRLSNGTFAVRPKGTIREILDTILNEVNRVIVRPDGKPLRPFEMSREAWEAVTAAGRLGYFPQEALAPECIDQGTLFADPGAAFIDPQAHVDQFFRQRFGYGTNGPEYAPGSGTNSRHEVHVAYALQRGETVKDSVLNAYRANGDIGRHDLQWMRVLIDVPALRGALAPNPLQWLCAAMRHEHLPIAADNARRLINLMKPLPMDCTFIQVDDALFAGGVLPPRTAVVRPPVALDPPASPLAARIRDVVADQIHRKTVDRVSQERARGLMSQREVEHQLRLADQEKVRASYEWGNRVALAVLERNVAALLDMLDTPADSNTATKRAIREVLGVSLTGVTAAIRRRRIFDLCGFSVSEQQQWDAQAAADRANAMSLRDLEEAAKRAEATNYRLETGAVLNGREYVDLCIAEGFSKICHVPTGSARRYYIQDPGRQAGRPLRAKDGTLAYAQARLAGSAVDVTVAA